MPTQGAADYLAAPTPDRGGEGVRSEVYQPNGLMILDQSLIGLKSANVTAGLQPGGWILINSPKDASEFAELQGFAATTVDASSIGRRQKLGSPTAPIVNTAMVGAVVELTGIARLFRRAFPQPAKAITACWSRLAFRTHYSTRRMIPRTRPD